MNPEDTVSFTRYELGELGVHPDDSGEWVRYDDAMHEIVGLIGERDHLKALVEDLGGVVR